ncbi:unnamed protein product [Prorocentrum cordatum]|uniref:Uncharacterized protein n=1 Tax=Prorocentrum cordatum TaxID=2364126 RepID=A0ABN9V852_9DINO|nr:unnamed protein product [Polarella glacialis]
MLPGAAATPQEGPERAAAAGRPGGSGPRRGARAGRQVGQLGAGSQGQGDGALKPPPSTQCPSVVGEEVLFLFLSLHGAGGDPVYFQRLPTSMLLPTFSDRRRGRCAHSREARGARNALRGVPPRGLRVRGTSSALAAARLPASPASAAVMGREPPAADPGHLRAAALRAAERAFLSVLGGRPQVSGPSSFAARFLSC